MSKPEKYRLLLFMAGVAVLLLFLAAAITKAEMLPGNPFPLEWKQAPMGESVPFGNGYWFLVLIRGFLILCLILIPVYIIINLLTPEGRKRLLKGLIKLIALGLILFLVMNLAESVGERPLETEIKGEPVEPDEYGNVNAGELLPTQPVEPAEPSQWLDIGICLGLAFILAILISVLGWGIYRASREAANDAMARLGDEARGAVDAIQAGENIRDTVIRCYVQMTLVLAEERNTRREEAMTPHEFEQILLNKLKLPETPVRRLTGLFEAVRYGDYHPGKREELEAIDSLTAIATACKSVKVTAEEPRAVG
jgi:hypothetical protein